MPKLTVLVGVPCSGKSTFCKKYPEKDVISRDAIRIVFFNKPYFYTKENEDKVTRIQNELIRSSVNEKKDIIMDNTHCKEAYINEYFKKMPEGYEIEVIFFNCPLWKLYIRNIWRYLWKGKWIPIKVIDNMFENYNKIDKKKYEKNRSVVFSS